MFGFGKKSDAEVVNAVCANVHPLFIMLEARLGGHPRELTDDPFVIGFVITAATIFAQVETKGKATQEQKGLASLSALQVVFMAHGFTQQNASAAMHKYASHPDAKRGARAADLMLGVAAGFTDKDNEPEIIAVTQALAAMPKQFRETIHGSSPRGQLVSALQEELFLGPLSAKYKRH